MVGRTRACPTGAEYYRSRTSRIFWPISIRCRTTDGDRHSRDDRTRRVQRRPAWRLDADEARSDYGDTPGLHPVSETRQLRGHQFWIESTCVIPDVQLHIWGCATWRRPGIHIS